MPGRWKLFVTSADESSRAHDLGPRQADVTAGSRGVWECLHDDWSDHTHVVMTTTDANVWGGDSGHTYTLTLKPDGTTDIDAVVVREGKNLKGRLLGMFGKRVPGGELGSQPGSIAPSPRRAR